MTKFKVGDIVRIKVRKIKKFDPEELHKAYKARSLKEEPSFQAEDAWVDDMNRLAGKQERQSHIRTKESADPQKLKFLAAYGEYTPRTYVDLSKEEIGRIATKIEADTATKKVAKIRSAFKKIILDKRSTYLEKAPIIKDTLPKTDWARTSPVLTKAILNIRKTTQPKEVLTEAGKARDIQRISAEASAFKIASQRAETFKAEAAKSGLPVERIGDLEKKFLVGKSKLVKAPVKSQTAIDMGFPGKGAGYDPYGIGTANEYLLEFGQRIKPNPKIRHPFKASDYQYGQFDYKFKADVKAWKAKPVIKGITSTTKHKYTKQPIEAAAVVTKVKGQKDPGGKVKFFTPIFLGGPGREAGKGNIGGFASRYLKEGKTTKTTTKGAYSRIMPYSGRVVPSKVHEQALIKYAKSGPKRTKAEIGYSSVKADWSKANQRLESEFLKGLERKKGPFHWE